MIRLLLRPIAALLLAGLFTAGGALRGDELDNSVTKIFGGESPPSSLEELRRMEVRQRELAIRAVEVTVGVRIGPAQGSGVIISKDGYVLTAAHVAQKPGLKVVFVLPDGSTVEGETLGLNRDIDAGLMKINDEQEGGWPFVEMGDYEAVRPGQWVMATGHPGGYIRGRRPVVRLGRVIRKQDRVLISDCPLIGGDSGGPLFGMDGKVVGINSRIGGALTANMHVPVSTFNDTWDRLVASEMWGAVPRGQPFIGVRGGGEAQNDVKGALVQWVKNGGPGDRAGLRPGDVVLKFGRTEVSDFQQLVLEVSRRKPGDKIKLLVKRGEEQIDMELKIGVASGG